MKLYQPSTLLLKFLLLCLLQTAMKKPVHAQKNKADSIARLLQAEKTDTGRVKYTWQLADAINVYNPDTAQSLSQQALYLARKINYTEGESRSLGILANSFLKIGNYPRALELNLQKLAIEEKRNKPRNLGSVLMNIGIVYVYQDECRKALEYYAQADSVIYGNNIEDLKFAILLNTGDAYNRLDISDSAYVYFNKALRVAREKADENRMGTSLTGLGHSFKKIGSYGQSFQHYDSAIYYLSKVKNDEVLGEAALGLAELYALTGRSDSAIYFANYSRLTAATGGFLSQELEACVFLKEYYRKIKKLDSAFAYADAEKQLNDTVNGRDKIRQLQVLSSNEQFRQRELEETRQKEKEERKQQLQLLLIGIFIPGLFLVTLLLSRVSIQVKYIRLLGILSLLFLFEYLTLFMHPAVQRLTHHTPIWEILIFVGVAAILIPAHHRIEHWMIHKLVQNRNSAAMKQQQKLEKAMAQKAKLKDEDGEIKTPV